MSAAGGGEVTVVGGVVVIEGAKCIALVLAERLVVARPVVVAGMSGVAVGVDGTTPCSKSNFINLQL